ncbi:hypothetical protein [uncultured Acetobacterium sp.]|uniref:hypothetical protein n=1 Tax=uncultured Acetobacterium sp. TaxID=217139 RepID=UPI002423475A|nr:hypothetical protein [uncultured Acetobacterium sp.]MBU4540210.1 hypothetical protein [Bacillota bacterium]
METKLKIDKDADIFKVFLAHWINHTGDHIEGYREWAEKLKGTSKDDVSREIFLAIETMREAQKKIMEAKIRF